MEIKYLEIKYGEKILGAVGIPDEDIVLSLSFLNTNFNIGTLEKLLSFGFDIDKMELVSKTDKVRNLVGIYQDLTIMVKKIYIK